VHSTTVEGSGPTPASIPLALYIHLPWCVRKCPYCDFNSHTTEVLPETAYVDALLRDLDADLPLLTERPVQSIFFGGGTPSLFSGAAIRRVLEGTAARVTLAPNAEITLEANPGTVDEAHFAAYREAGVNRLSLGVQSLQDEALTRLGRVHGAADARRAVAVARRTGFDNLNIDLMYGLPEQTPGGMLDDLQDALALEPTHLSWYQLTLEPGTAFARRPPVLPASDRIADEAEAGLELLAKAGFMRYEVSAYAREGAQCWHNLNYWRFGDYAGLGAGAHGKLTTPEGLLRTRKRIHPQAYLKDAGASAREITAVAGEDLVIEFMLNALRLSAGFELGLFTARTGLPVRALEPALGEAIRRGWLTSDHGQVAPTALGYRFLNDLQLLFLP
jgi:oxygen-independent coproporphyrinogen-3 oxidase